MEFFDLIRKTLPAVIKVRQTRIRCEDRKPIFECSLSGDVPELGSKIKTFPMNSNVPSMVYLLLCETCILFNQIKLKEHYQ